MFDRTLPIGSVVQLKENGKRVMIVGYYQYKMGEEEKIYDYVGCIYPEGFLAADQMVLFDHAQILHIYALGYQNSLQFAFREKLLQAIEVSEAERVGHDLG